MAKKIICVGLLILSLSLSGCRLISGDDAHPSTAQEKLISMDSYACVASVSHIKPENITTYETNQVYEMNGRYRFEVKKPSHIEGLTTIYNGEKVIQYNPQLENPQVVELPVNEFRNQIFLGTFVQNYLQSEDVAIAVQKLEGAQTTILEAIIPGGSKHMSTQRLWLDQKTHKPLRMAIYNQAAEETITIDFIQFTYNPQIDESIFAIE